MPTHPEPGTDRADGTSGSDPLGLLHRRYSPALRAYFVKRAPLHVDPDDLVQDVFIRLAGRRELATIRHAEGYLFQTAANVLRDHARRSAARRRDAHELFDEHLHGREDFSPERVLIGRETVEALLEAIEALPRRTRAVFVLHRLDGMRHNEIARRLGISVSSVEKHMMKALAQVARHVDRQP